METSVQAKGDHPAATLATPDAYSKSANLPSKTGTPAKPTAAKPSSTSLAKTSDKSSTTTTTSTTTTVAKTITKAPAPVTPPVTASTKNSTDLVTAPPPVTSTKKTVTTTKTVATTTVTTKSSGSIHTNTASSASTKPATQARLARLTTYWPSEGDYYTSHGISSTGIRLHGGHCAVDPRIIPYGSVVDIAGVGKYLAVDTGSAVISREAAREAAKTSAERQALVVDLYFENRSQAMQFSNNGPKYASISWYTPTASGSQADAARHLFADENWTKIQNKQL